MSVLLLAAPLVWGDQFDHLITHVAGVSTSLNAIAYGMDNYVVVGADGAILTTDDTLLWSKPAVSVTNELRGVVFGSGLFVVVGQNGTILTSSDGIVWSTQISGITNGLRSVAYGAGKFVAVGDSGAVVVSPNGTNWTSITTGVPHALNGIAYGLADIHTGIHVFVAVGNSGTVMTSATGFAWTMRNSGTTLGLNSVVLGINRSGTDVAVGQSGVVVTSSDTITWTVQYSGTGANLRAVSVDPGGYYSGPILRNGPTGTFGAVGDGGVFLTSSDGGVSWTGRLTETTNNLYGITFENGGFLAVGETAVIEASFVWLKRTSGVTNALKSIAWGVGRFAVVGSSGVILSSDDGANWLPCSSGISNDFSKIVFGGNQFIAIGAGGAVVGSTNGLNWAPRVVSPGTNFTSIAYGNGRFIIVGPADPGTSFTLVSSNAIDWVSGASVPALNDIGFGTNLFCGAGFGTIYTSPDGIQWSGQNPGFSYQMSGVTYALGMFVIAGQPIIDQGARMITSPDGTNWTSHQAGYFSGPSCSGYNSFVVAGTPGNIGTDLGSAYSTSSDGVNWTSRGAASITTVQPTLTSIAFGAGKFVAVGDNGYISQFVPIPSSLTVCSKPQGIEITITGEIGRNVTLEAADVPASVWWTNLFTTIGAPFRTNYVDDTAIAPQRYYRTRDF